MNDYNELIESLRSMEPMVCSTAADAIESLQSRVSELEAERAEREPAAWCCDGEDGREYNGTPQMSNGRTGTPLYAAPPVAAPVRLTDKNINRALSERVPGGSEVRDWFLPHDTDRGHANILTVVRAIETFVLRANGFKVDE